MNSLVRMWISTSIYYLNQRELNSPIFVNQLFSQLKQLFQQISATKFNHYTAQFFFFGNSGIAKEMNKKSHHAATRHESRDIQTINVCVCLILNLDTNNYDAFAIHPLNVFILLRFLSLSLFMNSKFKSLKTDQQNKFIKKNSRKTMC